jgi:hypothetical protein
MRRRGLETGEGPAELRSSPVDPATAALHTLVEQLADETPMPERAEAAPAGDGDGDGAPDDVMPDDRPPPKHRRSRRRGA